MADPKRARSAGLPTMKDGVDAGRWLCGPPELIREQILTIQEQLPGLEEINIGPPSGGVPEKVYLEQLEWFGREVMPTFKAQAKTAAPGGLALRGRPPVRLGNGGAPTTASLRTRQASEEGGAPGPAFLGPSPMPDGRRGALLAAPRTAFTPPR